MKLIEPKEMSNENIKLFKDSYENSYIVGALSLMETDDIEGWKRSINTDQEWTYFGVEEDIIIGVFKCTKTLKPWHQKYGGHVGYSISPKSRGKGLGSVLLEMGLKQSALRGLNPILLTVEEDNKPSIKCIEAVGSVYESTVLDKGRPVKRYWWNSNN